MKVFVVRDSQFTLKDNVPASNLLHYEGYASRYLQAFDEVAVVGRLFDVEDETASPVIGPGVSFVPLPGYHGPRGFLRALPRVLRAVMGTVDKRCAYILRVPATLPSLFALLLRAKGIPFGVEVAADPFDGYSSKALGGTRLAALWRRLFVSLVRWQCRAACATAYVTANALQRRYPPGRPDSSFSFTSLDLTEECFRAEPVRPANGGVLHMVMTGNMQKTLKGHDVLLKAMAEVVRGGGDVRATIIGFGENKPVFEALARELGIADRVVFTGKLSAGKQVRDVLDTADLFVLPSRQEGLPRALLEAMARGLPAIASDVGGTSELISERALVFPDDVAGLADRIREFANDSLLRAEEAARNFARAQEYRLEVVNRNRLGFFNAVANAAKERSQ